MPPSARPTNGFKSSWSKRKKKGEADNKFSFFIDQSLSFPATWGDTPQFRYVGAVSYIFIEGGVQRRAPLMRDQGYELVLMSRAFYYWAEEPVIQSVTLFGLKSTKPDHKK